MTPDEKKEFVELAIQWLRGEEVSLPDEFDVLLKDAEINSLIQNHPVVLEARRNQRDCALKGLPFRMPF
jgi:hypothetical protein